MCCAHQDARQYYTTLQSMDLVLPAFAPGNDCEWLQQEHCFFLPSFRHSLSRSSLETNTDFTKLASSTIHTSVQCNVPLLVTK